MPSFSLEYFKKKLQLNQHASIRIISDSMSPLITPGEIIEISPITSELNRFEIVLFDYYGTPFCHFYWEDVANSDFICTKSLKTPHLSDIPIHKNKLIGKITSKKLTPYQKFTVYLKIAWYKIK